MLVRPTNGLCSVQPKVQDPTSGGLKPTVSGAYRFAMATKRFHPRVSNSISLCSGESLPVFTTFAPYHGFIL